MMSLSVSLGVSLMFAVAPAGKAVQSPAGKQPAANTPAVHQAQAQKPATQKPTAQKPTAQKPSSQSVSPQKPAAQAPVAPKSVAQAPATPNAAPVAPAAPKSAAQAPAPAAKPTASLHPVEEGILARTNAQRARYGLRPLTLDLGLMNSARRHAQWMSRNRTLQHTSAPVAENIAMGQNSSQEAVNSWMNSSGHRANILNSGYSRIGVAAYRTPQGTTFWCQQFMR
jgi:uncharacterized protein YkwD